MTNDFLKSFSLSNIDDTACELIEAFPDTRLFAFYGEMGAGKTTFIRSLCRCLGIEQIVTSPTFAIVNEYRDRDDSKSCFHFDFYRIGKVEEALDVGYEDYFFSGNICLIEWPEKIEELLPDYTLKLNIEVLDDGFRQIRLL